MNTQLVGDAQCAKEVNRLDGPACHLEEMLKGLKEFSERLSAVADRMLGAIPQPVDATNGTNSGGAGVVGRYDLVADNYSAAIRRLSHVVERLERL